MKVSFNNLTKNERLFLISLLEDGRKTDTQISKELKMSLPTVTRIRKKLEEEKIISDYLTVVDLDTIGIGIFSVFLFEWKSFSDEKLTEKVFSEIENDPHIIFLARGDGAEYTSVLFAGFTNFEAQHTYFKEFRKKYEPYLGKTTLLVMPEKQILKNDFTDLVKHVLKEKNGGVE